MENNVKNIIIFFKLKGKIIDCILVRVPNKFTLENFASVFQMDAIFTEVIRGPATYKMKYKIIHKLLPLYTFKVCRQLKLNFLAFSTKQLYRKLIKQNVSSIYL